MFVRNAPKIAMLVTPEWAFVSYVTPLGHDISGSRLVSVFNLILSVKFLVSFIFVFSLRNYLPLLFIDFGQIIRQTTESFFNIYKFALLL